MTDVSNDPSSESPNSRPDPLQAVFPENWSELRGLLNEDSSFFAPRPRSGRPVAASSSGSKLAARSGVTLEAGAVLGGYKLLEPLGLGGMGQVWEAEEIALGRRVALKLVRPDRVSERALKLFDREARAGGRLSHPGIVQVHAHGETSGVHWISQELVMGGWTLRDFIDDMRHVEELPADYYRRVAEVVALVADALQAAHDAGVIHRDVKPQNVLIGTDDRPHLTDFGLARVEGENLELSQSGQLLGTYHYMSPEQVHASRSGIDHRTDVWSLGVVLYELLALQRPFEGDTGHQIAARILHADPPDLGRLRSRVPQDLAVIAGKALEKKPEARYATAAALASDLRAHLKHRPIAARPPTSAQRTIKWIRRNPTVSAAGFISSAAIVIIGALLAQSIDRGQRLEAANDGLEEQRTLVQDERDRLAEVVEFLREGYRELDSQNLGNIIIRQLRDQLDPAAEAGQADGGAAGSRGHPLDALAQVSFSEVGAGLLELGLLRPASERAAVRFADDPTTRAQIELTLGDAYKTLGAYSAATASYRGARTLLESVGEAGAEERLTANLLLAISLLDEGDATEADLLISAVEAELATAEAGSAWLRSRALEARAEWHIFEGRHDEAAELLEEVVARGPAGHPRDFATSRFLLASAYLGAGRFEEALPAAHESQAAAEEAYGPSHPNNSVVLGLLGRTLRRLGREEEALEHYRASHDGLVEILGPEHPTTLISTENLGFMLRKMGRPNEALPHARAAFEGFASVLGPRHVDTLQAMENFAEALEASGDMDGSLDLMVRVTALRAEVQGELHPATLKTDNIVAYMLWARGRTEEVEPALTAVYERWVRAEGENCVGALVARSNLGHFYEWYRDPVASSLHFQATLEGRERALGPSHVETLTSLLDVARVVAQTGDRDRALEFLDLARGRCEASTELADFVLAIEELRAEIHSSE